MPQFDFFTWISISFWTILVFQLFYTFLLRNFIVDISEFQKSLQKIKILLIQNKKNVTNLIKHYIDLFFKKKK